MNETVAKALCDANVVRFGDFTLASGRKSPIYIDLRILPSVPKSMGVIAEELGKVAKSLDVTVVAGAETAGIPIAMAISLKTEIPMVYVRRRPKRYGTHSMIEGILTKEDKVVLVDDLITNGGSKMTFVDGIKMAEAKIEDVLVILDREQGGKETLSKEGINLHSLITLRELLDYMKANKMLMEDQYKSVMDYLGNPEAWEAK
jgi:orotate phosphoribosyltransferase